MNSLVPIHFNNMFTYGASLFWANIRAERQVLLIKMMKSNKNNIIKPLLECSMIMFKDQQSSPYILIHLSTFTDI